MSPHFQLADFEIRNAANGNIVILVSGSRKYYHILRQAFRQFRPSSAFNDRFNRYDWGFYLNNVDAIHQEKLKRLLIRFQGAVCIDDAAEQTFALSYHMKPFYEGGGQTEIGKLVYDSKPYKRPFQESHRLKAVELANRFIEFIVDHPTFYCSDYFVPVPFLGKKQFDLPDFLVEQICSKLRKQNGKNYVIKVKETVSMKDLKTLQEKRDNIHGAFKVLDESPFSGKLITLIDDIYQTGETLHELVTTLQITGARVQTLVATKTVKPIL